jgi:choline dehydrogenase
MQPYFERSETFIPHPDFPVEKVHHGANGPWKTRIVPFTSPISEAIIAAGDAMGVKKIDDLQNPETQIGSVRHQTIVDERGRRHSTNQAYLTKSVRQRDNLTIGVGVTSTKIVLSDDGKRAIGVEFSQKKGAKMWVVYAQKEVILSAGSIGSPQLLMLSGIGPKEELDKHKIPVYADLPGVGQNLTDHLACGLVYYGKNKGLEYLKHEVKVWPAFFQWAIAGTGPLTSNIAESALFFRHEDFKGPEENSLDLVAPPGVPDVELLCAPANYVNHALEKLPQRDAISLGTIHIQPTSRGTLTLKDASIWTHPLIDPRYLSTDNDYRAMRFGLNTALKLAETDPLAGEIHSAFDFKKPKSFAHFRNRGEFKDLDDAAMDELLKSSAFTMYHPTGTAKMGPRSDVLAVVDDRLKVHGVAGLNVVDASIMPVIVRGHPQAAVVAIAEKASDMILADAKATEANAFSNEMNRDVAANGNSASKLASAKETPALAAATKAAQDIIVEAPMASTTNAAAASAVKLTETSAPTDTAATNRTSEPIATT